MNHLGQDKVQCINIRDLIGCYEIILNVLSNHCIQAKTHNWTRFHELKLQLRKILWCLGMASSPIISPLHHFPVSIRSTTSPTSKPQTNARHLPSVVGASGRSCRCSNIGNQRSSNYLMSWQRHLKWFYPSGSMDKRFTVLFFIEPCLGFLQECKQNTIKHVKNM